jgi:hypothetical protein
MFQQPRKVGAIITLCGGILALFAFFVLPLISINLSLPGTLPNLPGNPPNLPGNPPNLPGKLSFVGNFTAPQFASLPYSWWGSVWIAAVLALVLCLLALVPLFNKGVAITPLLGYTQPQPPHLPTPTSGYIPQGKSSRGVKAASIGIIVTSVIILLLCILFDISISQSPNTVILSMGFWVYALGCIAGLIGGIIQARATSLSEEN